MMNKLFTNLPSTYQRNTDKFDITLNKHENQLHANVIVCRRCNPREKEGRDNRRPVFEIRENDAVRNTKSGMFHERKFKVS